MYSMYIMCVLVVYIVLFQMYKKVQSGKKTFGLQTTADKAKKLVKTSGSSQASAEGGCGLSQLQVYSNNITLLILDHFIIILALITF